jgi:RNA polymerase sigma factor (sigma-70 family)
MSTASPKPTVASPRFPAQLREALVERRPVALNAFFDAYFRRVHGLIRRLVRDPHLTEDLTQDVFASLYAHLDDYDPALDPTPWVLRSAVNRVRSHWRMRGRRKEASRQTFDERDMPERHTICEEPDAPLEAAERANIVRDAVAELPEGMRVPVVLRIWEGRPFEEIGELLGVTAVTARKRYSRALARLRETPQVEHLFGVDP